MLLVIGAEAGPMAAPAPAPAPSGGEAPCLPPSAFLAVAFVAVVFVFEAAALADDDDGCGGLNVVGGDKTVSLRDLLLLLSLWFFLEWKWQSHTHTHTHTHIYIYIRGNRQMDSATATLRTASALSAKAYPCIHLPLACTAPPRHSPAPCIRTFTRSFFFASP